VSGFAFPQDTLDFLAELREHNDKAWFDANRDRYERSYVEAGKAFVDAVTPVLQRVAPGIVAEPKVLGSIFRINRDIRFRTDKRPYKDHLDFWFWHGDRRHAVSGLMVRLTPEYVGAGAGAHGFDKPKLARYRAALSRPDVAAELLDAVAAAERAGYAVRGETYTRAPKGSPDDPAVQRLLRHSSLFVHQDEPAEVALDGRLLDVLERHWRPMVPLHRWLLRYVQSTDAGAPQGGGQLA
jgi:uncharacterized protein (TIGR02453 family)